MKLFEYEGKELYQKYRIPTPKGAVISDLSMVDRLAIDHPVVIKAQVLQGGRGKAGGIKKAHNQAATLHLVKEMMNQPLKDEIVTKLLIEEQIPIQQELYLGITIDDVKGTPVIIACAQGGMDIEELAKTSPEKVKRFEVNPLKGLRRHECIAFMKQVGLKGKLLTQASDICQSFFQLFRDYDGVVAEINPLVITKDQRLLALDSKFVIDDSALFRQKDFDPEHHQETKENSYEKVARQNGFTFVDMEGNVGVISAGAGFTMTVLDLIEYFGGKPANFSDMMGGSNSDTFEKLASLVIRKAEEDQKVKSIVLNITLSATSLEYVINGLINAFENRKRNLPIVGYIRATDASLIGMSLEEAKQVMSEKGVQIFDNIQAAIKEAVEYTKDEVIE
ncbi:succinate--CoA ligase subunit beta [Bacillaceae bacterium S4-13-56]